MVSTAEEIMLVFLLIQAAAAFAVLITGHLDRGVVLALADDLQLISNNGTLNGTAESKTFKGIDAVNQSFGEDDGSNNLDDNDANRKMHVADENLDIKVGTDNVSTNQMEYVKKVYGDADNNTIEVGKGNAGNGYYYIYGEDGSDYINAATNAYINGGVGDDVIYCAGYECEVNGDEGNDEIHIQIYDVGSRVSGGPGNDKVFGTGYSVNGDQGNDYLSLHMAVDLKGGEGNDVLEVLSPSWETYYNGGQGADIFNCSPGPGDVVEDYNPEEGDTISSDCETSEGDYNNNIF
ncbi:MAG: hypothetical protein ACJ71B_04745 [Nitrososphaera sp.]